MDSYVISFWLLSPVARAGGAALFQTDRVQLTADDGVLHADVLHAAATQQHDRVFLEIMRLARNIGGYFHPVGEPHARYLTDGGVRLARGLRGHLSADTALEGRWVIGRAILKRIKAARERDDFRLAHLVAPMPFRKLIDGGHLEKEDPRRVSHNI